MPSARTNTDAFKKHMEATTGVLGTSKLSTTPVICSVTTLIFSQTTAARRGASRRLAPAQVAVLVALSLAGLASAQSSPWWLAQSRHFQVYTHVSNESARKLLDRFELLRSFWASSNVPGLSGLLSDSGVPLRVIEF